MHSIILATIRTDLLHFYAFYSQPTAVIIIKFFGSYNKKYMYGSKRE